MKKNRIKLIVLNVQSHFMFTDDASMREEMRVPIEPVYHRDGVYYDRKAQHVWVEVDGRAYEMPARWTKFIIFEIQDYLHHPMRDEEYKALQVLHRAKLLKRGKQDIRILLYKEEHARDKRRLYVENLTFILSKE